jgi:heat shock protein HslJ
MRRVSKPEWKSAALMGAMLLCVALVTGGCGPSEAPEAPAASPESATDPAAGGSRESAPPAAPEPEPEAAAPPNTGIPELVGTWTLSSAVGFHVPDGVAVPTIEFTEDGGVSGSTPVNRISGRLTGADDSFFAPLASTRRAGSPAEMGVESAFLRALNAIDGYHVDGDTLELRVGERASLVFTRSES